jgi:predicted GIY-YIG superfamily endonuclease
MMGLVYLLHFSKRYHHAQHYLGWTESLPQRMKAHYAGQGARLLEVVSQAGIDFDVVRTWEGDRQMERALKNRKSSALLCPLCRPQRLEAKRRYDAARRARSVKPIARKEHNG